MRTLGLVDLADRTGRPVAVPAGAGPVVADLAGRDLVALVENEERVLAVVVVAAEHLHVTVRGVQADRLVAGGAERLLDDELAVLVDQHARLELVVLLELLRVVDRPVGRDLSLGKHHDGATVGDDRHEVLHGNCI